MVGRKLVTPCWRRERATFFTSASVRAGSLKSTPTAPLICSHPPHTPQPLVTLNGCGCCLTLHSGTPPPHLYVNEARTQDAAITVDDSVCHELAHTVSLPEASRGVNDALQANGVAVSNRGESMHNTAVTTHIPRCGPRGRHGQTCHRLPRCSWCTAAQSQHLACQRLTTCCRST